MKFGTHLTEITDYLHAKFQLPTTTLTLDFETGSEAIDPSWKCVKVRPYEKFAQVIDQWSNVKQILTIFWPFPVWQHPVKTLIGQKSYEFLALLISCKMLVKGQKLAHMYYQKAWNRKQSFERIEKPVKKLLPFRKIFELRNRKRCKKPLAPIMLGIIWTNKTPSDFL